MYKRQVLGLVLDDALQRPFQQPEVRQQPRSHRGPVAHGQRRAFVAGLGQEEGIDPPELGRLARCQKGDVGPDQIVVVVGEVAVDAVPQVTGEAVVEKLLVDRPGQFPGQFQVCLLYTSISLRGSQLAFKGNRPLVDFPAVRIAVDADEIAFQDARRVCLGAGDAMRLIDLQITCSKDGTHIVVLGHQGGV